VVILDDFAMRELTATQADDRYELVSARAELLVARSEVATLDHRDVTVAHPRHVKALTLPP
jgi:hypothetical protein